MTVKVTRVINTRLKQAINNLDTSLVGKTGWFENARYPEAPHLPVAYIAAIQEKGYPSKNIPERPFIAPTIKNKEGEWRQIIDRGASEILKGNTNAGKVLSLVVKKASSDIQESISKLLSPTLKQSTINARLARRANKKVIGSLTKPLIDTGHMLGTVLGKVEEEK